MPETGAGDDDPDYAEKIAANADVHRNAWQRTLDDMQAMAGDLEDEGWDVISFPAGHTAPTNPDVGASDRFGFVHVVPDSEAESIESAVETGAFPKYQVFRNETDGRVFMVVQLLDPDSSTAILVASNFEIRHAPGLVKNSLQAGETYTHLQTLDKTHLASFRHDDVEKFFPDPQKYAGYQVDMEDALDEEREDDEGESDSE
ncbi:DUF7529 family protein [Halorussus litoreus]|uniref:DUF7529 family protein n=1 Tax=Halorussus litoreus TaxID=1710536 RepID=UPI000E22BC76|nr:hypothetical protein [Halorussus litoreus]